MVHGWRLQWMFSPLNAAIGARFDVEKHAPPAHGQRTEYEWHYVIVSRGIEEAVISHRRDRHGIPFRDLRKILPKNRAPLHGRKAKMDLSSLMVTMDRDASLIGREKSCIPG